MSTERLTVRKSNLKVGFLLLNERLAEKTNDCFTGSYLIFFALLFHL